MMMIYVKPDIDYDIFSVLFISKFVNQQRTKLSNISLAVESRGLA